MVHNSEVAAKNVSRLLINEYPLMVLPTLARMIGLNESIVLQQIHYWIQGSSHEHDGLRWIYNSYEKWAEQFPFWSERTIRTIINNLERSGLIISANYNKLGIDRTKWYTIAYDVLARIPLPSDKIVAPSGKVCHMDRQNPADHPADLARPLPETTTETNRTETTATEREQLSDFAESPKATPLGAPAPLSLEDAREEESQTMEEESEEGTANSPRSAHVAAAPVGRCDTERNRNNKARSPRARRPARPSERQIAYARSLAVEYDIELSEDIGEDLGLCNDFLSHFKAGRLVVRGVEDADLIADDWARFCAIDYFSAAPTWAKTEGERASVRQFLLDEHKIEIPDGY